MDEEELEALVLEETESSRKALASAIKSGEVRAVEADSAEEEALRAEGGRVESSRVYELPEQRFEVDPETRTARFVGEGPGGVRHTAFIRTRDHVPGADAYESGADRRRRRIQEMDLPGGLNPLAAGISAVDTATLGHADELAGGISALLGGDYAESRDMWRDRAGQVAGDNPGSALVGAGLGLGAGLQVLPMLSGARTAGGRLASAVAEGAGYGALGASGASEEELGSSAHLRDVGTGAVFGAGAGAAASGISEGVRAGLSRLNPERLREAAVYRRLRQLFGGDRPPRRTFRELAGPRQGRNERVRGRLRRLRELGVQSADDAGRVQQEIGDRMSEAADEVDRLLSDQRMASEAAADGYRGMGRTASGEPFGVDPDQIAYRIERAADELRHTRGIPDSVHSDMMREASRWSGAAESGPMTFRRAWDWRRQMQDPAYWTVGPRGELPRNAAHRRQLESIVNDALLETGERAAPGLGQRFRQASRDYALTSPLVQAADEGVLRAAQNRQLGLTSAIAGGGSATVGAGIGYEREGIPGMLAGAGLGFATGVLGNRFRQNYEHRAVASGMEALANLAERNPRALGRFGETLRRALSRGPGAFAATYYQLAQTQPEFRQAVERATSEEGRAEMQEEQGAAGLSDEDLEALLREEGY